MKGKQGKKRQDSEERKKRIARKGKQGSDSDERKKEYRKTKRGKKSMSQKGIAQGACPAFGAWMKSNIKIKV